jgi:hypothetical protein
LGEDSSRSGSFYLDCCCGKKWESLSELDNQPAAKKGADESLLQANQSLFLDMVALVKKNIFG